PVAAHRQLSPFPTRRSSDLQVFREIARRRVPILDALGQRLEADTFQFSIQIGRQLARRLRLILNDAAQRFVDGIAQKRQPLAQQDRKSTRLNSSHEWISYAV